MPARDGEQKCSRIPLLSRVFTAPPPMSARPALSAPQRAMIVFSGTPRTTPNQETAKGKEFWLSNKAAYTGRAVIITNLGGSYNLHYMAAL